MKSLKRIVAIGLIASSISIIPLVGANAEWRQDSIGWWNTEGDSYTKNQWKQIDGKWYYFNSNGYMAHDIEIDGYKLGSDGAWIQNITTTNNNSNNVNNTANTNNTVTSTSNSNNMTNLTNNTDNNTTNSGGNITLNNTGSISYNNNSNTTNNVIVGNSSKEEKNYYKELKKSQEQSNNAMKSYYEKQLSQAKSDLSEAQKELNNVQSQATVQTYKKQADGSWGFEYTANSNKIASAKQKVAREQANVEYYEKLVKQYS